MSASREKKNRQELDESGFVDPKAEKAAKQTAAEKRSNLLYGLIAVAFALVVICTLVWRSNIISQKATAVKINGENHNAAEVTFYYQNAFRGFLNQNSYFISYMGLDTSAPMKGQTVNATAASLIGLEEGTSWYDYFLDMGLQQMAAVNTALKQAAQEGFSYPDSVQAQYEESLASLKTAADASGTSVTAYLQSNLGSAMTEKAYNDQVLKLLKYTAYVEAYQNSLTYSDAELEEAYQAAKEAYDLVTYEYVTFKGTAESTTDASGNTVQPTAEEDAAANAAAKEAAEAMLAELKNGASLEKLAAQNSAVTYRQEDATYYGDTTTEWLFDSSRKADDSDVLAVGSNYYVVHFINRHRDESKTVDARHILFQSGTGTLSAGEAGYEEELASLKAAARAKAEDLLAQWKAGAATEDSFAALAMENTEDPGSKYTGGLYSQIYVGQMVEEFNDWCFDSSRKPGDTGIVDTSYGSHVMYFVGTNAANWSVAVSNNLSSAATAEWAQSFADNSTIEVKDFGMKFVG